MSDQDLHAELESLLVALECGELTSADRDRLNELLLREDGAVDLVVEQLEVEALLRWRHAAVESALPQFSNGTRSRLWSWRSVASIATAAAVLVALTIWALQPPAPTLVQTWNLSATGPAEFDIVAERRVRLTSGELMAYSIGDQPGELTIELPEGEAVAHGTRFLIGSHQHEREGTNMMTKLTRILVFAGTVTLTTDAGIASANRNEMLIAPQGETPAVVVARAGNDFGFDLYRELGKTRGGENLFLSPFSMATALTMTAEGARGDTAKEMGEVLRWPDAARRVGEDAQRLPFEMSRIHSGYTELERLFESAMETPAQQAMVEKLDALAIRIADAKAKIVEARAESRRPDERRLRRTERELIAEQSKLSAELKTYKLAVANSLWGEKTYPFAPKYLATIRGAYDSGALVQADFINQFEAERVRINEWVGKQTLGNIKELIGEDILSANTRLVLLNAIYFKGEWVNSFDKRFTQQRTFHLGSGEDVKTLIMHQRSLSDCRYAAFTADGSLFATPDNITRGKRVTTYPGDDGFHILEMPYRGRDLSMVVILPRSRDGLAGIEERLSDRNLSDWIGKLKTRKVHVDLPKFKAATAYSMKEPLQGLGMVKAFSPIGADFSAMTTTKEWAEQLYITHVLHQATVSVDEVGTEASAATAVIMRLRGGRPSSVPFVPFFNANQPFVYMIRDTRTGSVLFVGRMVKPQ